MTHHNINNNKRNRRIWGAPLFWVVFCAGLIVQAFAPRLKIVNRAFVIPPDITSRSTSVNPAALVEKERMLQSLSAILTMAGAVGLGFYYRRSLVGRRSV